MFVLCQHFIFSVSSFVRKTTEKIGTLHVNPDKIRHDIKDDDEQVPEDTAGVVAQPQEEEWVKVQLAHVILLSIIQVCVA